MLRSAAGKRVRCAAGKRPVCAPGCTIYWGGSMAKQTADNGSLKRFTASLAAGQIGKLYFFHGEERYLLDYYLSELRRRTCPGGAEGFNYRRFDDRDISPDELADAVDTYPAFAERTFIEIHDFNIFKSDRKQDICDILSELPEYVCIVLVFDTVEYKPDGRVKLDAALVKNAETVCFAVQEQSEVIKWVYKHFKNHGKKISQENAEYLVFITGGLMSSLNGEIEKVAAYAKNESIARHDIDAVVTPVLDAVIYKLTDALTLRKHDEAMRLMDELLRMQEAPHKIMFSISLKMRQLLAARVLIENGAGNRELMLICGVREEFQARALMNTARRTTLMQCRDAVLHCADIAYDLNSAPDPEVRMAELITKLAG